MPRRGDGELPEQRALPLVIGHQSHDERLPGGRIGIRGPSARNGGLGGQALCTVRTAKESDSFPSMPRTVIILRHAEPDVRPGQLPAGWPLSTAGRNAASAIDRDFLRGAFLASSAETKAVETIGLAAAVESASIHLDQRFGEVRRPGEPFDDNHRMRRRAWVEGHFDTRHETWETPVEAAQRFQSGLDAIDADRVAVATHGMVLTAWLVSIGHVKAGSAAGEFWACLRFPDMLMVTI